MSNLDETIDEPTGAAPGARGGDGPGWWLCVVHAPDGSAGLSAWIPREGQARVLGRGPGGADDPGVRLAFAPHRPARGAVVGPSAPLLMPSLSRVQAVLRPSAHALQLEAVGRAPTFVNGVACSEARLDDGDVLRFGQELVCVVVQRPHRVDAPTALAGRLGGHGVGQPDALGLVGESAAMWQLRERVTRAAQLDEHVLILGPSGVGKELVARGIWSLSRRSRGPFVSRNAATLPESLIDAELFGNIRDYPNPGMRARPGLVGEAHGGALFLDEIGELPLEQQAHLLRVLDNGEYQNLGDARVLKADLRFIGATNRAVSELKSDFGARIYLRIELPTLGERIEDLPWLVRHLLRGIVDSMSDSARRGFGAGLPMPEAALVEALARHRYTLHLRELRGLLLTAMTTTPATIIEGGRLALTPEVLARLDLPSPVAVELDADAIRQALATTGGNTTRAAEILGLPSRYALYRWMKKLGLS